MRLSVAAVPAYSLNDQTYSPHAHVEDWKMGAADEKRGRSPYQLSRCFCFLRVKGDKIFICSGFDNFKL